MSAFSQPIFCVQECVFSSTNTNTTIQRGSLEEFGTQTQPNRGAPWMKLQLMVRAKHQCGTHLVQIQFPRFTWFLEGGGIFKSNKQGSNLYFAMQKYKTLQLSRVVSITIKFSVTHPQLANFNYRVFTSCFNRPELNRTILQLPATICSLLLSFFAFSTFFGTGSQIY